MFKCVTLFFVFSISLLAQSLTDENLKALLEEHGSTMTSTESVQYFRDSTSVWDSLTPATVGFGRAVMGTIGDYVYVFTGQGTTSLALAYHIPTNTWMNSTPCTAPGYNSGFCVAKGELYKASGTGSVSVFEKFTPAGDGTGTWTVLTAGPTAVMNAQNSLVYDGNNSIYFSSGSYSFPYPSSLVRYSISEGTFETKTGSPYAKKYAGMAVVGKYIYLIGGLIPTDSTSARVCQRYDTATDTWSIIADIPEDINFSKWSVTTDGHYVFLLGSGGGYSTYPHSPNAWYYDPDDNTWAQETPLPAPRGLVHGIFLPTVNKLFWGGGNNTISSSAYQPHVWEGTGGVYIPVELVSFTADISRDAVLLKWKTASEKNNSHFVIERSSDGISFKDVTVIPGAGTSTEENIYAYSDFSFSNGINYYRLKQVDYNGTYNYSGIISVDPGLPSSFKLEQNYPNPFNPSTTISYTISENSLVLLQVFDPLGNCVATPVSENKSAGNHTVNFDASGFSSGVYYYKLTAGKFSDVKKLMVLK